MADPVSGVTKTDPARAWMLRWMVFLALTAAVTWGARGIWISHVERTIEDRQARNTEAALDRVAGLFVDMQAQMRVQAASLVRRPDLLGPLRRFARQRDPAAREALVRLFARNPVRSREGVELWDLTPQVIIWTGLSMPLDDAPGRPGFLEVPQSALSIDGDKRKALVVWCPVKDGATVLGAVRVVRLLYAHMPVSNKYLQDVNLADSWSDDVGLPVEIDYAPLDSPKAGSMPSRLLKDLNGDPILRVLVEPQSPNVIVSNARDRFDGLLALWLTLFMIVLCLGFWRSYVRTARNEEASPWMPVSGAVLMHFLLFSVSWWGFRFILLLVNVPGRWQTGKAPLSPLFDPVHLASDIGGGMMRSTGDLLVSALFALIFAAAFLHVSHCFPSAGVSRVRLRDRLRHHGEGRHALIRLFVLSTIAVLLQCGLVGLLATVTRHTIFDSTLDFFSRTGLLPGSIVLVVFSSLILITLAVTLMSIGLTRMTLGLMRWFGPVAGSMRGWILLVLVSVGLTVTALYAFTDIGTQIPLPGLIGFLIVAVGGATFGMLRGIRGLQMLSLRSVLLMVFLLAVLLYPLVYTGLDSQSRGWMVDAAESFEEGESPRVYFAVEKLLEKRTDPSLLEFFEGRTLRRSLGDSVAMVLLRHSLLSSLGDYDIGLTLMDADGRPVARHDEAGSVLSRQPLDEQDRLDFDLLLDMYNDDRSGGSFIQQLTGRRRNDRQQYVGIVPVLDSVGQRAGWLMVRAEPRIQFAGGNAPFPSVLLPASEASFRHTEFSTAAFHDGILVRSQGRNFGRYRLPEDVAKDLLTTRDVWRTETVKEERFLTYFHRVNDVTPGGGPGVGPITGTRTIAVRAVTINTFDHLYYLLRLTVAGLVVGLPIYLIGLVARRRRRRADPPREHFRDKVLNAFFAVGLITAAAMGMAGLQVVSGENERAIQSWLEQHLERVEETLAREAHGEELPYSVLSRIRTDSLALQVGLDLNIYRDGYLVDTSRPQLVYDRLIQDRLPVDVYEALYFDGFRFTFARQEVGNFVYTAGYRALSDEQGIPRVVISVPTLPEQERIEEEKARTIAYLFGALLLLVFVVVLTAGLLANALARPIARLREGLEAVAQGRFEKIRPIGTHDEIGELVETFNEMQGQLAESRRKLARQERQLAWREMARQVAHEIKNPLTPMRLKVQHLQIAFDALAKENPSGTAWQRFRERFLETMPTLLEQIDALVRIAREFSTFARMPKVSLEPMDLNAVIVEAITLMQEEVACKIEQDLAPTPLVLMGDRQELRRIFINLIKNARQAIPERGACLLEISTERQVYEGENFAYATVTDTGTGIPEDLRDKIFEPNFSTKTSGTGLGLAIVRQGVEALNGEIGFETEVGVGTTFWVRLPLAD